MSITSEQARTLGSGKVVTTSGAKIGSIGQVYLDDSTGEPAWVTVKTGLFGSSESFVPLQDARLDGSDVVVGYDEDQINNAPRVEADGSITPQEEDELYSYYGLSSPDAGGAEDNSQDVSGTPTASAPISTGGRYTDTDRSNDRVTEQGADVPSDADDTSETGDDRPDISGRTVGADRSGPTADDAMTRSEERLKVGTESREAGRARLRKFVTTETVTQTVPVRHEEVTVTREPITADNYDASQSGPAISEEEHEVVLHEEVPVVEKEVVAVERVKLGTETVTEQATVSDEVRNGGRDADTSSRGAGRENDQRSDADDRAGTGDALSSPDGFGRTPATRDVVAAQKERFGGMKFGSCFFGWLTATGTAVLLTSLLTAAGAAVGLSQNVTTGQAQQNGTGLGLTGAITLLVVVLVAYLAGGYVAGRMARFNGLRQGLGVWLWSLIAAVVVAVLTLVAGAKDNVLGALNGFPQIPVSAGTLSTGAIIAAIILVVAALVGALLGGLAGMRFHRRVDRATHDDALGAPTTSR